MANLTPLIITACDPLVTPLISTGGGLPTDQIVEATVREICESIEAGAAISHHHGVYTYTPEKGYRIDEKATNATVSGIRSKTDAVIQMGGPIANALTSKDGQQMLSRMWQAAPLDMISVVADNIEFLNLGLRKGCNREETKVALRFCREQGVKPEFEIWQMGGLWTLKYLLKETGLEPPFWVEMLHGAEGAAWSPATPEETLHRVANLPEGCLWHVNAYTAPKGKLTPEEHTRFLTEIIIRGGHVRIGKEDRPELTTGQEARSNAELVEHIAWIARKLGRKIATAAEARKMLGLRAS